MAKYLLASESNRILGSSGWKCEDKGPYIHSHMDVCTYAVLIAKQINVFYSVNMTILCKYSKHDS